MANRWLVTMVLVGCASSSSDRATPAPTATATATPVPTTTTATTAAAGCQETAMTGEVMKLRETTSNTISQKDVGISNIFERDLPDDKGAVASRLSAVLVIHDPDTDAIERKTVFDGNEVTIGADRWCVLKVERGNDAPGWVSLRKIGQ